jgi:superfamily II DNA or RNA helicase
VRILILGINHQIQWVRIWSSSTTGELERFERGQKDQYRELLRKRIAERQAQFIGEETKHGEPSIAEEVCASEGCRYFNIEMHPDERREQKVSDNYENDPSLSAEERTRFNKQREDYMFRDILAKSNNAESIIAICGRNHVSALAARLRGSSHQVEEEDIQSESWYVEDWMTHMLRL